MKQKQLKKSAWLLLVEERTGVNYLTIRENAAEMMLAGCTTWTRKNENLQDGG